MRKSHFYYIVSLLALTFAALGSCQKDDGSSLLEEQKRYKFTLSEAKEYFYSEATDLQLPLQTIGKVKSGELNINDITTIDWKRAEVKDYTNYLSYEVPLHNSRYTHAVMLQKIGVDSVLCENADVRYSLLLQRAKSKDTTRMLVSTIISLAKDRKRVEKLQSDRFHGNRRGFTGYVIVSTLDGEVESIYSYDKGRREYYSKYTISPNVDSMRNNSGGFSFVVMGGGGDGGYGYSEQGHCRMCGKYGLLYQPDWYCLTCTTHELPGPVVKPGDGGGDSHVCDKCGEIPCVCCHCGGGCHCDCGHSCINCSGNEDPFACPYCGQTNCPGDCQRGNGGGGREEPTPPRDQNDTSTVEFIRSAVIPSVMYDSQRTAEINEESLLKLYRGNRTSNMIEYLNRANKKIVFMENEDGSYWYAITKRYKRNGEYVRFDISYYTEAQAPMQIMHEFTHIWFLLNYSTAPSARNKNSEILSLLGEFVYAMDYLGESGVKYDIIGFNKIETEDGISVEQTEKYILPFWNNPNMETLNNLLEQFDDVRKDYKDYTLDYNTIIEQVLRFKSLFSN